MKIAVIGLGAMGLGIAQVFARAGYQVLGYDNAPAARETARDRIAAALAPRLPKNAPHLTEERAILARFHLVPDLRIWPRRIW